jgi:hypothetical protein
MIRRIVPLALTIALLAACTGDSDPTTTTTQPETTTSSASGDSTTSTTAPEASDTTLRGQPITDYQTVARLSTANGEVLHIVVPAGGYTDIDLYNFIADLKRGDPDLWGVEVFDHPEAPAAFGVAEAQRDGDQVQLLRQHHLISLVSGETVRYQGPFSSFGESILGS